MREIKVLDEKRGNTKATNNPRHAIMLQNARVSHLQASPALWMLIHQDTNRRITIEQVNDCWSQTRK